MWSVSDIESVATSCKTLDAWLQHIGRPVLFVLEGGYAASELGTNAANVADGFGQA